MLELPEKITSQANNIYKMFCVHGTDKHPYVLEPLLIIGSNPGDEVSATAGLRKVHGPFFIKIKHKKHKYNPM